MKKEPIVKLGYHAPLSSTFEYETVDVLCVSNVDSGSNESFEEDDEYSW